ncbi:GGDEF domain-containing protein [Shewanella aestuarii]|uniref:Diguanylate cyclase n=1 Tax=Shewanella aestuarii TaxID=1028752 RepID=A0A6G9QM10_9GAMM|nr:GGDEF domain-containing protein [Shewanella aestuarii]QIR15428.1 diguanylate cyclase [Shewanella aestuarii]
MLLNDPLAMIDISAFFSKDNPFLQFTIDTLPVPIFYKDINGIYLGCNKAFEDFIKISREDLVGASVYDLFAKDLADIYQSADKALFDNPGVQIYEVEIRNNEGEPVFVKFHKTSFVDLQGNVAGLIGVIFDITEQKKLEATLINNATFDVLTGCYNRREGIALAVKNINLAINGDIQYGVMMIDVDHFKRVNDQHGHGVGDKALQHIADLFSQIKGQDDTVIRWGGEEFLILVKAPIELANFKQQLLQQANVLRETLANTPLVIDQLSLSLTISCGVSHFQGQTLRELINQADTFLYMAKNNGRNQVCSEYLCE